MMQSTGWGTPHRATRARQSHACGQRVRLVGRVRLVSGVCRRVKVMAAAYPLTLHPEHPPSAGAGPDPPAQPLIAATGTAERILGCRGHRRSRLGHGEQPTGSGPHSAGRKHGKKRERERERERERGHAPPLRPVCNPPNCWCFPLRRICSGGDPLPTPRGVAGQTDHPPCTRHKGKGTSRVPYGVKLASPHSRGGMPPYPRLVWLSAARKVLSVCAEPTGHGLAQGWRCLRTNRRPEIGFSAGLARSAGEQPPESGRFQPLPGPTRPQVGEGHTECVGSETPVLRVPRWNRMHHGRGEAGSDPGCLSP